MVAETKSGSIDVQFGARVFIRPELITDGDGTIEDSRNPIVGARGTERDFTLGYAKTGDAVGGILIVGREGVWEDKEIARSTRTKRANTENEFSWCFQLTLNNLPHSTPSCETSRERMDPGKETRTGPR